MIAGGFVREYNIYTLEKRATTSASGSVLYPSNLEIKFVVNFSLQQRFQVVADRELSSPIV